MGTAVVNDRCTTVGPELVDPIITLAPGELSTWNPSDGGWTFTVGEIWQDPSEIANPDAGLAPVAGIAPLEIKDLACPTWGLGTSTSADGTVVTTIGAPWLPLIIPPTNIFALDPIWAATCTGMFSDSFAVTTFALFDPPIALTPAALLVPTPRARPTPTPIPTPADPTTVPLQASPSVNAAKPAPLPNDPAAPPAKTGDPGEDSPTQGPVKPSADPASLLDNLAGSPKDNGDDPPPDPPSSPPSDPPSDPPTSPKVPIVPSPRPGEDPQAQNQGLGAIIYNAFGRSGPEVDGSSASLPPQSVFIIGAQTFTANPTGFKVNDAAITAGGTGYTVDGTKFSLGQSGILAIGGSTVSLANPFSITVLAVAGQTFTPNPSGFPIAGSIVSAGGPAVTVGGTAISLDPSGVLAIDGSTISLTTPSPTPFAAEAFTVAGQTFTPNPFAFAVAGTTISADGPAVTMSGTVISLGQNGVLSIGSSTISLPSPSDISPGRIYTVAGQTFTSNPSTFAIAGTAISAGGPAVTIDGTVVSLGQLGALIVGGSTVDVQTPSYTAGKAYTVAGHTFTPNPSAFAVAGTIVSAGGPAAVVDGTTISLQSSGTLVVGSSTIPLLTSQALPNVIIDGFDVEAESSLVVVDGTTVSAAAAGVTISGQIVSLEAGGATLDIGTGRFALPTGVASGSVDVQGFTGGQRKGLEVSFASMCGVYGIFVLLVSSCT